jgi:hypothetical protein
MSNASVYITLSISKSIIIFANLVLPEPIHNSGITCVVNDQTLG